MAIIADVKKEIEDGLIQVAVIAGGLILVSLLLDMGSEDENDEDEEE